MRLPRSVGRALSTVFLFIAITHAQQQCYYPDGTPSPDVPCSEGPQSSCCGATSWCMDNGLCFAGGLVSRGSCTDKTWNDAACTKFCRTESPSGSIPVTPCAADGTFSCGLNSCGENDTIFSMSGSGSMVLRASQVQALVANALQSQLANVTCAPGAVGGDTPIFTASQVAAVGCGLGIPLLLAVVTVIFLLHSRRGQWKNNNNDPPPDPRTDIRLQPPVRITDPALLRQQSYDSSERASSSWSRSSSDHHEHIKSWNERYKSIAEKVGSPVRIQEIRVELDASAAQEVKPQRHELGARAKSPT